MEWLLTLATLAALLVLFAGSEAARRRGVRAETTRGLVHVMGAGTAATFPLYLQLANVLALALTFTAFLTLTWIVGSLRSIHGVARRSLGAMLFPIALGLTALAAWGRPAAFAFGALVLAVADPVAGAVGRRAASPRWSVPGATKSLGGSLAFFAVSALLASGFVIAADPSRLPAALGVAAGLTLIEGSLGYGLDNLPIPLAAALAGETLLGL
jgi:dolichol kinase